MSAVFQLLLCTCIYNLVKDSDRLLLLLWRMEHKLMHHIGESPKRTGFFLRLRGCASAIGSRPNRVDNDIDLGGGRQLVIFKLSPIAGRCLRPNHCVHVVEIQAEYLLWRMSRWLSGN